MTPGRCVPGSRHPFHQPVPTPGGARRTLRMAERGTVIWLRIVQSLLRPRGRKLTCPSFTSMSTMNASARLVPLPREHEEPAVEGPAVPEDEPGPEAGAREVAAQVEAGADEEGTQGVPPDDERDEESNLAAPLHHGQPGAPAPS